MRVVVKLGTNVLTAGSERLHRPRMVDFVRQMAQLRQMGHEVILVTSGAVAAGRERLALQTRSRDIAQKQMLAAVGQSYIMHLYQQLFELYSVPVGQTLLTKADLSDRHRYLNARNTLLTCFDHGVLPIINENDAVAVDEIKVGDNDNLSALVANLIDADLLIIVTDIDGLYTAPRSNPTATLIPTVYDITPAIYALAGGTGSSRGTGGMITKIQAADLATKSGVTVVIAPGALAEVITRVTNGDTIGTRFPAKGNHLEGRKRWILAETARNSKLAVDSGAANAITTHGKSLLPAGITAVEGDFER
ncbi:MAG: glutamate 5-kinase, partial [Chloroflexia bacterium]|nr:glutamate 5-kinase [Chloroflexia bacterium]